MNVLPVSSVRFSVMIEKAKEWWKLHRQNYQEMGRIPIEVWYHTILMIVVLAILIWHIHRYWFFIDDAFISFRYAKNLVAGKGLAFNPGEAVEGYTNFLWVILMAIGIILGIEPEAFSLVVSISCGVSILFLLAYISRRLSNWRNPLICFAPLLLATHRSYAAFCTGGLETQFFSLLCLSGLFLYATSRESKKVPLWASAVVLGAASLTRPEGVIFAFVVGVSHLIEVILKRQDTRSFMMWCLPYVGIIGSHFIFRLIYYGYPLPNTFYAKVSGFWLAQSKNFFICYIEDFRPHYWLPFFAIALAWRKNLHILFFSALVLYLFYVFSVGGDVFEYRFFVPVLPLYVFLLSEGFRILLLWSSKRPKLIIPTHVVVTLLCLVAVWVTLNGSNAHRAPLNKFGIEPLFGTKYYAKRRISQGKFLGKLVEEGLIPADSKWSTGGVGALPYYSGLFTIDEWGLNDEFVAHIEIKKRGRVAHEKRAPDWYLRKREVDLKEISSRWTLYNGNPYKLPRYINQYDYKGPVHCLRVKDRYLIVGTLLSEDEFWRQFGHLKIVF